VDDKTETYLKEGYWKDRLLSDYFEQAVNATPEKIAVSDERFGSVTYAEMATKVGRLAASLQARGINRGDRFIVSLPNWHQVPALALALDFIGAIAVHMPFVGGAREYAGVINVAEAKGIAVTGQFRSANYMSIVDSVAGKCPSLKLKVSVGCDDEVEGWESFDSLVANAPAEKPEEVEKLSPSELSLLLFTSGSTGDPKGVMHSTNSITTLNVAVARRYNFSSDDVIFMAAPFGFSGGYAHGLRLAIFLGATLILQDQWDSARALEIMTREKATFTMATPTLIRDMLNCEQFGQYGDSIALKVILCGGAYVSSDLLCEAREKMPRTLTTVIWGMTEGVGTTCRPDMTNEEVTGSDGVPFWGTELKIISDDDKDLPVGEEGDMVMRGPSLFMGYYKRPELNDEYFMPGGWFRTGDMGRLDSKGMLHITGRRKELIIRGGANISPAEIEESLQGDPRIRQLAVVGVTDHRLGEKVFVCVVPNKNSAELTLSDILEIAESKGLAKYKWPESMEIVDALPVTSSGKLKRMALREIIEDRLAEAKETA
jgi:cyclohexanecarboxylate-CoA ligase